jgi:hypothetical protein
MVIYTSSVFINRVPLFFIHHFIGILSKKEIGFQLFLQYQISTVTNLNISKN